MSAPKKMVAYGDCNTLGFTSCEGNAWPEQVAREIHAEVKNLGHTMSTTRELLQYARDYPAKHYDIAVIQYGLVDSWMTFRHSPYVLYYPSNPWRKFLRKLVKKIKKYARILRLHDVLGWDNVVPVDEYVRNIEAVVASAPNTRFILLGTAPNHDLPRNPRIETYNAKLAEICARHPNAAFVDPYARLLGDMSTLYFSDGTHLNAQGQAIVARLVADRLKAGQ
jgi:lysophospholipase L1-like esterase